MVTSNVRRGSHPGGWTPRRGRVKPTHEGLAAVLWFAVSLLLTAQAVGDQPKAPVREQLAAAPRAQAKPRNLAATAGKSHAETASSASRPADKKSSSTDPQSPRPRSDLDVQVRTKAEMAKPKSPFLSPDGSPEDRYATGPWERHTPLAPDLVFRHPRAGTVLRVRRRLLREHDR